MEGISFNVYVKELDDLIVKLEFDLKWLINSIKLIKIYIKKYKSETFEENGIFNEISDFLNYKKIFDLDISNNSYITLIKIINHFNDSIRLVNTSEYKKLIFLKNQSDQWNLETQNMLNSSNDLNIDKNIILTQLEKTNKFPTDKL